MLNEKEYYKKLKLTNKIREILLTNSVLGICIFDNQFEKIIEQIYSQLFESEFSFIPEEKEKNKICGECDNLVIKDIFGTIAFICIITNSYKNKEDIACNSSFVHWKE